MALERIYETRVGKDFLPNDEPFQHLPHDSHHGTKAPVLQKTDHDTNATLLRETSAL